MQYYVLCLNRCFLHFIFILTGVCHHLYCFYIELYIFFYNFSGMSREEELLHPRIKSIFWWWSMPSQPKIFVSSCRMQMRFFFFFMHYKNSYRHFFLKKLIIFLCHINVSWWELHKAVSLNCKAQLSTSFFYDLCICTQLLANLYVFK